MEDVIFYGNVINGKKVYDRPNLYQSKIDSLEGKKFQELISEVIKKPTPKQYAYYFGGIIRISCMSSEIFRGWTEKEIDDHLRMEVGGKLDLLGNDIKLDFKHPNFSSGKMTDYIEAVISYLSNWEIEILSPNEYSYCKNNKKI